MKIHKQYINEWKSINDDVKKLAITLVRYMWYKSESSEPKFDNYLKLPFISGSFQFEMNALFKDNETHFGMESINVWYKIYFVDDEEEYNEKYINFGNSEYNQEDNTIYIRGGLIRGQFSRTIVDDVYHELNHAFEYGMGMEKREDLYEKVSNAIQDPNNGEIMVNMCKMVYYTFPHEQDAFAHQFYGYLNANGIDESFEELLYKFPNYVDFQNSIISYSQAVFEKNSDIKNTLDYLGLAKEQFDKRWKFGKKRFIKKLRRVHQRHMYELKMKGLNTEGHLKYNFVSQQILEEYKKRYKNIDFEKGEYKW